ncbi:MAG: permease [Anaerolineae bacterium]|nr:permease [Anaerolineae bacterium]
MNIAQYLGNLLQTGLGSLAAYLAAHVLLCLLPAFLIAGALTALVPKEAITKYLGRNTPKWISYPAAAIGGFVLAVCSCTIMPLFAGIYKKGAGLGPAITFLFVGPAINILAITLTGVAIGMDIALARVVLSIIFGVGIGLLMAWFFRKSDAAHDAETNQQDAFAQGAVVPTRTWAFFALLLGILIAGTLQVGLLTNNYLTFNFGTGTALAAGTAVAPVHWSYNLQTWLNGLVPPNPSLGIEGVSVQGVLLIGMLAAIGVTSWKGLERVDEGLNTWTFIALGLITLTLLVASFSVKVAAAGMTIGVTGKLLAELALLGGIWWMALKKFETYEIQEWLWELWRFVKQIMPLLLAGVFVAGMRAC